MQKHSRNELIKIVDLYAYLTPPPVQVPVLQCDLEDGRTFSLYYIPMDIMLGIMRLRGEEEIYNDRETFFDIIQLFRDDLKFLRDKIEMIVVDEFNKETNLYTASIYIKGDGYSVVKRMVPSHALFLAYLLNIPAYVRSKLVDEQERSSEEGSQY
ncbi:MAG: hypothetical protein ACP5GI_07595 [Sulfolobales archaeon]